MDQINIFDMLFPKYKIKKPIRLIELFAGIGAQSKSLERLQKEFNFVLEHYKVVEFDKYAIASYNAIHNTDFKTSDITKVHAKDLEIVDTENYDYIMTYSFPCQDLSLAGKMKGMSKGSGTRSGLLWEVERILDECNELPRILLMENVPQVISSTNMDDFHLWQRKLEELGYSNYVSLLNAKDYGIPQNRNRCFMISILGQYNYSFPKPFDLKLRLNDMLEKEVDEKYYLNDYQIELVQQSGYAQNKRRIQKKDIYDTLCARDYKDTKCIQLLNLKSGKWDRVNDSCKRVYDIDGLSPTITTCQGGNTEPKIVYNVNPSGHGMNDNVYAGDLSPTLTTNKGEGVKILTGGMMIPEATKKGYAVAQDGDGVYIDRPHQKRGCVQKNMIQTIKTSVNDIGVVIKSAFTKEQEKMITEFGDIKRYINSDIVDRFKPYQVADISFPKGYNKGNRVFEECPTINATTTHSSFITKQSDLRIRKLTPLECWRLMGFDDEDFYRAAKVNSNTQLYKQAGNSIVVDVLYYIFREFFI